MRVAYVSGLRGGAFGEKVLFKPQNDRALDHYAVYGIANLEAVFEFRKEPKSCLLPRKDSLVKDSLGLDDMNEIYANVRSCRAGNS